eukprot:gene2729-5601_t
MDNTIQTEWALETPQKDAPLSPIEHKFACNRAIHVFKIARNGTNYLTAGSGAIILQEQARPSSDAPQETVVAWVVHMFQIDGSSAIFVTYIPLVPSPEAQRKDLGLENVFLFPCNARRAIARIEEVLSPCRIINSHSLFLEYQRCRESAIQAKQSLPQSTPVYLLRYTDENDSKFNKDCPREVRIVSIPQKRIDMTSHLHLAALYGDTCALNRQAQRDCYFLERDKLGQTPLHYACMCGHLRNVVTIIQYVDKYASEKQAQQLRDECRLIAREYGMQHIEQALQQYPCTFSSQVLDRYAVEIELPLIYASFPMS